MKRIEGIYTNCKPEDQPEGYYRDALNVTLDESLGAVVNELGTQELVSVGDIIGHCVLPNGSVILFEKGEVTDRILLYDGSNLTVIVNKDLGFDLPITAIPYLNEYNEYIVFWVDGNNPARFANITNVDNFSNNIYYNLFPATDKLPNAEIQEVFDTGGALKTGAYYFSVAYIHKDGTISNFYDVTGPAYITNADPTESGQPGELTSKSIKLNLSNLDTEYQSVQIAVVRKIDGIFDSVELLPELPTSVTNFTYTGNEAERPGALEEIQIDNAVYDKPKTLAYQDDNLYLGNVEEPENKDDFKLLQQHVNDVVIKPSVDKELHQPIKGGNSFSSFSNVNNATKYRGFRRGEVYAFYMSFIRKDGTETKAFHVPGRAPVTQQGAPARGRIRFFTGLEEGSGIAASSYFQTLALKPRGDGLITVTVNGNVTVDIFVNAGENRENVVEKIVQAVNTNATMNAIITAERDKDRLKFTSSTPGSADNGLQVYLRGEPSVTGNAINVSDKAVRDRERTYDPRGAEFFFGDSNFTLFGGRDSFDTTISVKIDTEELNKEITISNLTSPSTTQQLANEIASGLNGDLDFSANYTASVEEWTIGSINTGRYDIVITAGANGDSYNGDLELDPQDTYLSYDNPLGGSFSIVEELNGGQDTFDERDPIYGQGDPNLFNSIMYNGLADLQDPKHFRFRSDNDAVTGMGYWENANETYPNDVETWGSLNGQPVRHHHFPDVLHDPYIQRDENFENQFVLRPMGVKVENITIPTELQDDIVGYKVYYAKRTEENKRILDTVAPISAKIQAQKYVRNAEVKPGREYADDTIYTYPFSYLKDKKNLNNATHLALFSHLSESEQTPSGRIKHVYDNGSWNLGYTNYRIESSVYVDSENSETSGANLKGYGFEYNLDNSRAEAKLVMKLKINNPLASPMQKDGGFPIGNICAHKTDVYNSFDLQQLVYTNYTNTNKVNATTFENSATIYGGDTFIVPFSYRARGEDGGKYDNLYTLFLESSDNINLRMRGDEFWEYFYPAVPADEMRYLSFNLNGKGFVEDTTNSDADVNAVDNYLAYNTDYSEINDIKYPGIYGKQERVAQSYPTRIIRNSTGIRTFKQDDFLDLNKSRGEITKLSNYNNVLIPHMERALVRTRGKEDIQVGDMRAFLGTGDIFSVRPDDIIYTDLGFAGLQNKRSAISTPYGYFFFDDQSKRMYGLTNEGIADISENILPEVREFSNVELGYNPKDEVIITKTLNNTYSYSPKRKSWISRHSYSPDYMLFDLQYLYSCSNNNLWKHGVGRPGHIYGSFYDTEYEYVKNQPNSYKAGSLLIDSNTYINYNNVITINDANFDYNNILISDGTNTAGNSALEQSNNYSARLIASVLSNEINNGLNAKSFSRDNKIFIYSDNSLSIQYSGSQTLTNQITLVQEQGRELNKNSTFDKFRIHNSYQDTELENIEYFKDPIENKLENIYIGNARNVLKYWVINKFRDVANIPSDVSTVDQWAYKRRMEDKYHIVKLIKDNRFNENVYLFGSDIVDKTSIR